MTKKILSLILVFTFAFFLFCSCQNEKIEYKDDVNVEDLISQLGNKINKYNSMSNADNIYFKYKLGADENIIEDWALKLMSSGVELDEISIFKANTDADIQTIKTMLDNYITARQEEWTGLYGAEDYPKLRDAEYKVYGKYVICLLLSEEEKKDVFNLANEILKK